jgi:hypothetical protein
LKTQIELIDEKLETLTEESAPDQQSRAKRLEALKSRLLERVETETKRLQEDDHAG